MTSRIYIAGVIAAVLAMVGAGNPAKAEDAFSRTGAFVIPEADVIHGLDQTSCTDRNYDVLESGADAYADRDLRRAICHLHDTGARTPTWEMTTALLAGLQTRGLPPAQQSFAALAEGILHCRIARDASKALMSPQAYVEQVEGLGEQIKGKLEETKRLEIEIQSRMEAKLAELRETEDEDKRKQIGANLEQLQGELVDARKQVDDLVWQMKARTLSRTRFCTARKMSFASFASVDWTRLQFSYASDEDNSRLNSLMRMYRGCFVKNPNQAASDRTFPPLSSVGNSQCGIQQFSLWA